MTRFLDISPSVITVTSVAVLLSLASAPSFGAEAGLPAGLDLVAPIDWARFQDAKDLDADCRACGDLLRNCGRYILHWIPTAFEEDPSGRIYVLTKMTEHGIRPSTSSIYALAALIATGAFDAAAVGLSQEEAIERTIKLIRGVAATHKVHRPDTEGWGDCWQSALWAAQLGFGGWMLWDHLDSNTRGLLIPVVEHEADRFLDYQVPYSNENKTDTKAEENSWNSMILNVAVAMMPRHPHVVQWKRKCSELMVSSYATEKDWRENATVLDGQPVRQWLAGFNAFEGGIVYNHGFLHPDYMVAETMSLWAYIAQSLAGGPVPETADFNGAAIYRTLVTQSFPSPPFEEPGGAIYKPGQASIYYPKGVDWSKYDLSLYYLIDVWAHVLGWDKGLPEPAVSWVRLRAAKMLEMQQRHEDRRMFAKGEYDTYEGAEPLAAWCIADAYFALWLDAHRAMSRPANWLAPTQDE